MKKTGILIIVLGLLLAGTMYFAKESNKPVCVTIQTGSHTDTGYMMGYGDSDWEDAKTMFNFFIGFGVVVAVAGVIVLLVSARSEGDQKRKNTYTTTAKPSIGWRCVCGRLNPQAKVTCACGKGKPGAILSQRWQCDSCGAGNPPAAKSCVRCGAQPPNYE